MDVLQTYPRFSVANAHYGYLEHLWVASQTDESRVELTIKKQSHIHVKLDNTVHIKNV